MYLKRFFNKLKINNIPSFKDFIKKDNKFENIEFDRSKKYHTLNNLNYFIETYGCQMNESDSEIVSSILENQNMNNSNINDANFVFLNTCSIRENAEKKIWSRLHELKKIKIEKNKLGENFYIGILGCMAERLKENIVEKNKYVDIIVGPDSYRDIPRLIDLLHGDDNSNNYAINVQLSQDETYADINPIRTNKDYLKSYLSIMRGCNNMCSYCVVPFTRGIERSRDHLSILDEVKMLRDNGCKEITLLGQNVNSYVDSSVINSLSNHQNSDGFSELYKARNKPGLRFDELLEKIAIEAPNVRIRFTSPHPKDFPNRVIDVISHYKNICNHIHLPAQSGNNEVLKRMRRYNTKESYIELSKNIRNKLKDCSISSDFICGFCDETEEEFQDTLDLIKEVKYDFGFLFAYSMREKTHAHRKMQDNVPEEIKKERLQRMIDLFRIYQNEQHQKQIGSYQLLLIDGKGKLENQLRGKIDNFKTCIVDNIDNKYKRGDFVKVKIENSTSNTLFGKIIEKSDIQSFYN